MDDFILLGGRKVNIGKGGVGDAARKAILSIPGWTTGYFKEQSGSAAAGRYSKSAWANRCIQIRMNTLAAIPWQVQTISDEPEPKDHTHDAVRLLTEVNAEANWSDLMRATSADMDIFGQAFWEKVRNEEGTSLPLALRRLNPSTIEVKASKDGVDGFVQTLGGKGRPIVREDMVFFHEYDPENDFGGKSLCEVAAKPIEADANTERYISAFFENYALPPVVFTTEQSMSDGDVNRLSRWWSKLFRGVDNQHKAAFVDRGMKPNVIGYPPADLALKEIKEEARRAICSIFGVGPALAGAWEAANYATAMEQRKSLYTETIIPRADYFAGVINAELIQDMDESVLFVFMVNELSVLKPDAKLEADRIAVLVRNGVIKPEVGAVELGYEESDAGVLNLGAPNPVAEAGEPEGKMDFDRLDMLTDLRKWRRKCLRRMKRDQPAMCDFRSGAISDTQAASIKGQLKDAQTVEDIATIFSDAERWSSY